jgi:DNA mismatch repair protein MutS
VATVEYRHQVFLDLDRDETRQPIANFVHGMRATRRRLDRAEHVRHPLQQQGWFLGVIESYCEAISLLRDGLSYV